jgi:hypothetical protein
MDANNFDDDIEFLQACEALEELQASNGILFYEPHPKQDMFHRAGSFKRRYVRTGNRFGKSTMGAAEDVAWALGYRPWYPEGDPARYEGLPKRSVKILVIAQDWDKVNEIFTNPEPGQGQGKIFKLLPKDKIVGTPAKSKNGVICMIKVESLWGGSSTIYFDTVKSYMANPMGQESSDWDAIHIDEPCPKEMWTANARGLVDRDGSAWFTCTPLSYMWINDMFIPRNRLREEFVDEALIDGDFWMVTGSMRDNPTLKPSAIEMFLKDLSPSERQCREKGLPLSLSGLIYKQFEYDTNTYSKPPHGWETLWNPPKDYTIRVSIDPHPEVPHAVLCAATAPSGEVFFFHEIFHQCIASTLAEMINDALFEYEVARYIMDPAGFIESPTDKSSMATEFDKFGIYCDRAPRDLARGVIMTQQGLSKKLTLPSGQRVPWLRFGAHLQRTLWEFDHYEWQPGDKNKPIDKDDHMMECLYRLIITGLDYLPPEVTGGKPLVIPRNDFRRRALPHYGDRKLKFVPTNGRRATQIRKS